MYYRVFVGINQTQTLGQSLLDSPIDLTEMLQCDIFWIK